VSDNWIELCDGSTFDYNNPNYNTITIEMIAHSLSQKCRFNGHTKYFYSVAQHSLNVMYAIDDNKELNPVVGLVGLLHDSVEAFVADIPSPLKQLVSIRVRNKKMSYSEYENIILNKLIYNLLENTDRKMSLFSVQRCLDVIHNYDIGIRVSERDLLFSGERIWNKEIQPLYLHLGEYQSLDEIEKLFLFEYHKRIERITK
jgi:hypothetical protein